MCIKNNENNATMSNQMKDDFNERKNVVSAAGICNNRLCDITRNAKN